MNEQSNPIVTPDNGGERAVTGITIVYINLKSNRRGNLGTMGSTSSASPSTLTKPYSADSAEVVTSWYYISITSTTAFTLTPAMIAVTLSGKQSSSVTFHESNGGLQVSSVSIPANKSTFVWVATTSFPSSFFYNLPTNDGQSPTIVGLSASVLYQGTAYGLKTFHTRWNA